MGGEKRYIWWLPCMHACTAYNTSINSMKTHQLKAYNYEERKDKGIMKIIMCCGYSKPNTKTIQ